VALVHRLASKGRIAWASSWQGEMVSKLEAQLALEVEPLRATIRMRPGDEGRPTPNLRSVAWLDRMEAAGEADWDAVVRIDDVLGPAVHEWAQNFGKPVLAGEAGPGGGTDRSARGRRPGIHQRGGEVMAKELPAFDEIRSNAFAMLGDVEDELRSDCVRAPGPVASRPKRCGKRKGRLPRRRLPWGLGAKTGDPWWPGTPQR
jgi:hypothetical protein